MRYNQVVKGTFLSRPNRFIAYVELDGKTTVVHVKNTGRCRELLVPGSTVYLECAQNQARKTPYDLIAVEKQRVGKPPLLINMDSQVVNAAVEEWLRAGHLFPNSTLIRREVTWGKSRFDFYIEVEDRKIFLEVKGVTLEEDGIASFPDAPTERGIKHLGELVACQSQGYEAYVLFVIQMAEMHLFIPNDQRHKAFGEALREAQKHGVTVLAYDCHITHNSIALNAPVPISL